MGSVRNKRHSGRQQQHHHHHHQATKKREHKQQQQQHRQNLRLTLALTKSGGVELKKPRKSGGEMSGQPDLGFSTTASESPAQQRSESATGELNAEEGQVSPLPSPPSPQGQDDLRGHDAAASDRESSTTVDASSVVSMETVPEQQRIRKRVVMTTKSDAESDAEVEDKEQKEQADDEEEDYEKRSRQSDQLEVDGDGGLSVTCGENVARLYLSKLRLIARERVQSQCIRFDGAWLTPNEFQRESGREAAKDWKRTIRHNGLCLKQLLSDGIFDFSVTPPLCLCVTCAAAAAASARRIRDATTNEEMEITAPHPSPGVETSAAASCATPDQEECLISGLGSAAGAATDAVPYRSGDGEKKEKRRRRSKQRPAKEKRKPTSSTTSTSSALCLLTDDPAMFKAADNSTRKKKSSSRQFNRPTEQLTDVEETSERLTAKSDEMTTKSSDALDGVSTSTDHTTTPTDQTTLELNEVTTTVGQLTSGLDGVTTDITPASELHPAMPVIEAPDGDIKCDAQESGPIPKKKRRKKSKKNFTPVETSETQQLNRGDFVEANVHSLINPKISKENQDLRELTGKSVMTHIKQDDCKVQASACFQALPIYNDVQKLTCGLNEDQQVTTGKYQNIVDGYNEKESSAESAVIRNPNGLDTSEMEFFLKKSLLSVNSGEDDCKKRELRESSVSVSLKEKNVRTEIEFESQVKETEKLLDTGDIPCVFLSSVEQEVCSQRQQNMEESVLDKSAMDNVSCESIQNIPPMPLAKEGVPIITSSLKTDLSDDSLNPLIQNPPVVDVQSSETLTVFSDQSAGNNSVSEASTGGLPATTSRNPHLVAVIAELKQKKQLALTSGVKKKNETVQSTFNSDQSRAAGVSGSIASDAKLSFDVASRFLAATANPLSLSFSPPCVDGSAPVSSTSDLCQSQKPQKSSGSHADLTQSATGGISKAVEGVIKHKTKPTSGGRSESNRKRSCRSSTTEGKTNKALDGGKHVTSGKEANPPSIPLSLPSGLYGLSPSQLASLPFPASPYSLFPPYLFMGFPLQPLMPSCPSSDGKLPSFGMGQTLAAASATTDQPQVQASQQPQTSRKRRSNQSGKSQSQKGRRGSQSTMTSGAAPTGPNPMAALGKGTDQTATSDLLNSMMAFDLLRSRIGLSPSAAGPGLDSPNSAPFYFPWLKPDPSKQDVLFGAGGPSSSGLLRTMTSDAKLHQAATRTLAAPSWSDAFLHQHEQHSKRPKMGDFRPYDPMSGIVDRKATPPPLFSPDFKVSRRRGGDKASLPSTDQKPFSLAVASEHSSLKNLSLPGSQFYDDVGALDLSLK